MKALHTEIEGVIIFEPKIFTDARGYFFESFSKRDFFDLTGFEVDFVQDNQSSSSKGVVRGLHFQRGEYAQAKLVRCISGRVLDVAVDLRKDSPTYGKHISVELTGENFRSLYIPRGFAHGFAVLSEKAVFQYKCDNYYHPEAEGGISILDSSLRIDWRLNLSEAILSEKDKKLPYLSEI